MVDTALPICIVDGKRRTGASLELLYPVRDIVQPEPEFSAARANAALHYIPDNRSPQSIFRGELTYFYRTGRPILLERDARRSWKYFAEKFRLLPLPGPHGEAHLDPQLTALKNLTSACLDGMPPKGCDPASVFERFFHIEQRNDRETILGAAGEVYRVRTSGQQGCLELVWSSHWSPTRGLGGRARTARAGSDDRRIPRWPVARLRRQRRGPTRCGAIPRRSVCSLRRLPLRIRDRILDYSGGPLQRLFVLTAISGKRLRLFVLSRDGGAVELQYRRAIQFRRIVGRALGNWPRLAQVAIRLVPRTDRFVFGPRRHN